MERSMAGASAGIDRRAISLISISHVFNDINQSIVPALLPFLIASYSLSYAAAAGLVLALSISSSVVQPFFGHWADKRSLPYLLPGGMVVGAIGIAALTRVSTYPSMVVLAVVAGIGIAAFHPEAARFANFVSRERRSTGMGLFNLGGNLGFALGPIVVTPLLLAYGLPGAAWACVPGLVVAAVVARNLPYLERFRPSVATARAHKAATSDEWGPFAVLTAVIVLRSMAFFAMLTFVPLYLVNVLGQNKAQGNAGLALMLVCGAIATVLGGRLGDSFERRAVTRATLAGLVVFTALLVFAGAQHWWIGFTYLLVGLVGMMLSMSSSITAVMGQDYLPARIGTASGVTLGLSISLGGIAAPVLGALADRHGLAVAIGAASVVAFLALVCAFALPSPAILRRGSRQFGEAETGESSVRRDPDAGRKVEAANGAAAHRDPQSAPTVPL
jgi:MFS transporter, FSR family, fosmidomycin resistance protein